MPLRGRTAARRRAQRAHRRLTRKDHVVSITHLHTDTFITANMLSRSWMRDRRDASLCRMFNHASAPDVILVDLIVREEVSRRFQRALSALDGNEVGF